MALIYRPSKKPDLAFNHTNILLLALLSLQMVFGTVCREKGSRRKREVRGKCEQKQSRQYHGGR